jgi:bla regulator protein blaR1
MNLALPSGPLAQAIGWALLHLVWQGAVVAVLLAALLSRLSGRSANLRYAISCAALALIVALGAVTVLRSYPGATTPAAAVALRPAAASVAGGPQLPALMLTALLRTPPDGLRAYVRTANNTLPMIVAMWLVGVAILSLRLILEWLRARQIVNRSTSPARDPWQQAARRLGQALGVRHAVRLLESAAVEVPSVIGFLRPAILLPASTLTGLTPAQLEMILAHELAHIRRHDFLVNLLQTAVETLLFYHPAVWWISRQVRIERENCCDDLAVALCGNPVQYARALARLEELRTTRLPLAVSATGGSLFHRVRRLVDGSTRSTGPAVRGASAAAVLSCLLLVFATQSFSAIGGRKPAEARPHRHAALAVAPPLDQTEQPGQAAVHGRASRVSYAHQAIAEMSPNVEPNTELDPAAMTMPDPDVTAAPDDGRPSLDELIALRAQNVTPEMIREMRTLFPSIRLMEIATMSAVGVTGDFVRGMRQLGLDVLTAGDAQGLAAVGVTREYVRAMRAAGFPLKSASEAQGLKAVGVTPEYVREMRDAGFPLKSAGEAQGLMAVGVTPEYVSEMRDAGVTIDDAGDVQSLRALGVTPDFVRRLASAGYANLTVSQLSRLAAAGVTGDFVREMSKYRSR